MKYVLPVPTELRGAFPGTWRLYAYPVAPELPNGDETIILDSGAFALSFQRRSIDAVYMRDLAEHYGRYSGMRHIAPDVYLNPHQTIKNWQAWHAAGYPSVVPVIQATRARSVDLYSIRQQALIYRDLPFIAYSNPGFRGLEAQQQNVGAALRLIRNITGTAHIHILGAGWDRADIKAWLGVGGFDSLDSIAYYTAAQSGQCWTGVPASDWRETAKINACAARMLCGESHELL